LEKNLNYLKTVITGNNQNLNVYSFRTGTKKKFELRTEIGKIIKVPVPQSNK